LPCTAWNPAAIACDAAITSPVTATAGTLIGLERANVGDQPEAVLAGRHAEIGHEHVGRRLHERLETRTGGRGGDHDGAAFDEVFVQGVAHQLVVVDEQNADSGQRRGAHDAGPPGHPSGGPAQAPIPSFFGNPATWDPFPGPWLCVPASRLVCPFGSRSTAAMSNDRARVARVCRDEELRAGPRIVAASS
jgi:hypothetical protein